MAFCDGVPKRVVATSIALAFVDMHVWALLPQRKLLYSQERKFSVAIPGTTRMATLTGARPPTSLMAGMLPAHSISPPRVIWAW